MKADAVYYESEDSSRRTMRRWVSKVILVVDDAHVSWFASGSRRREGSKPGSFRVPAAFDAIFRGNDSELSHVMDNGFFACVW